MTSSNLLYSSSFNLSCIFQSPGQALRVFVPVDRLKIDSVAFRDPNIFGKGPYAAFSDIAAIIIHKGIVFPDLQDRGKLMTSSSVFQPQSESPVKRSKQVHKISQELCLSGVVVEMVSKDPLKTYHSSQRYSTTSKECESDIPFSIDIQSYFLSTNCQQAEYIKVDNIEEIRKYVYKYVNPNEKPNGNGDFPYTKNYFTKHSLLYILDNYSIKLFTENGEEILIKKEPYEKEIKTEKKDVGKNEISCEMAPIDDNIFISCSIQSDNVIEHIPFKNLMFCEDFFSFDNETKFAVNSFSIIRTI